MKYRDRIRKIKYKSEKNSVITSNFINTDFRQVIKACKKKNKKEQDRVKGLIGRTKVCPLLAINLRRNKA